MNLSLKKPLAFFDLETTGINIVKDRIIEIAVVKVHPNGQNEEFHSYVNPEMPVPASSRAIHGISDDVLKDKPKFKEVAKKLLQFFEGADLSGFNILKFDVPILTEEFLRVDMDFDLKNRKIIDSQKLFFLMEPRNLAAAYQFYCEKNLEDAHSAMADTKACAEILDKQVERYEGRSVKDPKSGKELIHVSNDMGVLSKLSEGNLVDLAGRMVYDQEGNALFNFGKHKGQKVADVLKKEPQYYKWIMNSDFALDTKRKLTEIKLLAFAR